MKVLILNGWQWRIQGRGPGLSLIFGPYWGPKGRIKFFLRPPPPPYLRVWMSAPPSIPYLKSGSASGWCSQRKSLPTELPDSFKDRDTQDGIIFRDPKCVISISTRPKDKEKPNNNISVGKDAWSCVLAQHEQRTEINFLKVWNLQHLFKLPNKRNLFLSQRQELRWLKRRRDVLLSME